MAQPGISAKIEELQFRIKTDPRSRLFFPLAEELRRNGKLPEAEQVLRTGLGVHATYLSAWVSLGRVLREQHKNAEAVDALNTALQVDPGNVVAARLLADAYFDLGEKVEAIKKYKLVHALMPSDEELKAKIEQIDRDLQAAAPAPFAPVEEVPESPFAGPESGVPEPQPTFAATADAPFATSDTPFDETMPITRTVESPFGTGDEIPMSAQHAESPFEEPSGYTAAALEVEQPARMHIEEAPLIAEGSSVWLEEPQASEPAADVFAPSEPEAVPQDDDVTATTTMADLYVRQGLIDEARKIYEHLLQRDPYDEDVRTKLDALDRKVAELPSDEVAETIEQPSNRAPEPEEAVWPLGSPATDSEPPQPGDPATLHRHAQVVVLRQWLARVSRRETTDA
ncbi:MAG TPA: tetratricopeptide repeat protein [Thermoanaerobaculia bacterium]|jgi:tetratricopeptide (TPR) repeat protein|nr:tetratricopeptide repeat protein [Thermoanaerobaculia bacterium]